MEISDTVWLAIIGVITMIAKEYFDRLRAKDAAKELKAVKDNVVTIELATNSMKDALVKATGDARFLEGKIEEQGKADMEKAANARGQLDERERMDVQHLSVDTMSVEKTETKPKPKP